MAKTGPKTHKGITAVTRNLPSPELSGPRTERGKRRSSLNSLKHGLATEGFLSCKKEGCYFREVCRFCRSDEGRPVFEAMAYGDPCPVEVAYYYDIRRGLAREGAADDVWAHMWAMNEVRMMRRRELSAVDAHLLRDVPADVPGYVRSELAVSFRYQDRLHSERGVLLGMLAQAEQ